MTPLVETLQALSPAEWVKVRREVNAAFKGQGLVGVIVKPERCASCAGKNGSHYAGCLRNFWRLRIIDTGRYLPQGWEDGDDA